MSKKTRIAIVAVVALAVAGVMIAKSSGPPAEAPAAATAHPAPEPAKQTPRLVDLGRGECIPCKMMKPELEKLHEQYGGRLEVEYIDIQEDAERAAEYTIRVIPTQILYDADGDELMRHEGFWSAEEIVAEFEKQGVELED